MSIRASQAFEKVKEFYNWSKIAEEILEVYKK